MLKGKTAVVTGGSRGIGKAICLKFAENGADIAFLYAGNTVKAEETVKELEGLGVKAKAYQCNVADADAVAAVVKEIVKDFGGIQILVNNAGITKDKLVPMMKAADFDAVIDTNLKGAFYMTKGVYPLFLKQKGGKIINISSVSGLTGNPAGQLFRIQGRGNRADKIRCKGTGFQRGMLQCNRSRLYRNGNDTGIGKRYIEGCHPHEALRRSGGSGEAGIVLSVGTF